MDEQTIKMINPADDDDEDYDDGNHRSGLEMIGREKETEKDRGLRRRTERFRRTGPGQEEQEQEEKEQEQERARDVARPDLSPQAKRFSVILPRNKSSLLFKRSMFQHIYWCLFHFFVDIHENFSFYLCLVLLFFLLGRGGGVACVSW